MVKSTKFGDKIALFWTFKLLRKDKVKKNRDSRKLSIKNRDSPSKIGMFGNYANIGGFVYDNISRGVARI